MNQSSDVNAELQQVSAYPTKQEMNQKDVALLNEQEDNCCTPKKQATEAQRK
ncbi:hypothetical protein [Brevibacillus brevis]|uniref:hypothetical protein n=1 Tax=Brevibacillus brevis TaxID=1393 RepID=UPI000E38A366|nr:hypothetical protein [Brevibacillus brevis]RED35781.1 hypothetical protein DES34_101443 [Brevibacillus brevis]GEC89322.1 hypothetical protein BBR01nite_16530 [Brevibacillus brevis]VEF89110.1 Uncharacterised protein [Brevibacillus brevis]